MVTLVPPRPRTRTTTLNTPSTPSIPPPSSQDQLAGLTGAAGGSPPPLAVAATLGSLLAVNAAAHVCILSLLLAAALRSLGLKGPRLPGRVSKALGQSAGG